jgi:membrane-bound hydrogenase subunit beta
MASATAKEIIEKLQSKYSGKINDVREERHTYGIRKKTTLAYWLKVDKEVFKDVVKDICAINYPYLSVISGKDHGKEIELIYHLFVNHGGFLQEESLNLSVFLPKDKPELPTITDIIPGAMLSELEKQEMLGVDIQGIGDEKAFLPDKHPKGDYPWRKKENA